MLKPGESCRRLNPIVRLLECGVVNYIGEGLSL